MLAVCPAALGYDMMGAMLTIATVNVNGLRAAWRKGMPAWIDAAQPDIILMQEVRAPDDIVHGFFSNGWSLVQQACDIKGRAGVAIATRHDIIAARIGLGPQQPEIPVDTGRWVEADIALEHGRTLTVVSAYIHSGTAGTPKMDEKYSYLNRVTTRLAELNTPDSLALVAGDINIAHTNNDIKNWRGNKKSAGFLPEERAYLDQWFDAGWHDTHRDLVGEQEGPYTWWSNRGQAFDNDSGWRIDYHLTTPELFTHASYPRVDRAPSYDTRWSDHAPLVIDYSLTPASR
ncbi:exodeoxyribonuclease III Xth [Jonesia denitrificans DSM 20603]|uniref:Exodeoxyribonuclease III Xth n=2 Tax=Jonesia TaxID=43673 RepID=C7R1E7_JONDD|nr:exodeoxyribonuclease III Xth [Jonesia denitrificans DSM 20603]